MKGKQVGKYNFKIILQNQIKVSLFCQMPGSGNFLFTRRYKPTENTVCSRSAVLKAIAISNPHYSTLNVSFPTKLHSKF